MDDEENAFLNLINQYRAQNGLKQLVVNAKLTAAADWLGADLGSHAIFSHTDSLGHDPWVRTASFGYQASGENIAAGVATGQAAFDMWRNSPGHNANMLGATFLSIGISRVYTAGSPYGWYWTTDFGNYVE